jgi:predicted nicotinamide N-methyase
MVGIHRIIRRLTVLAIAAGAVVAALAVAGAGAAGVKHAHDISSRLKAHYAVLGRRRAHSTAATPSNVNTSMQHDEALLGNLGLEPTSVQTISFASSSI